MKVLTLLTTGLSNAIIQEEEADKRPRASLYQRIMNSDMMNEQFLYNAPFWRRWIYKYIPTLLAQILETYFLRKKYDIIISWSDPHALIFALLLKLTGKKIPHVALMFWISKPKKAALLKKVQTSIDRIVLWTSTHRDFAINVLGIPPTKIKFIPYYVDQKFWRPIPSITDKICSVGVEMRDYPTLINALKGLDIHCHIAAGPARGKMFQTVEAINNNGVLPSNVTVFPMSHLELRNLYAQSRFVVIPLLQTDSDNGLTSILEAMAMGKAVICSRTKGQIDVIREGVTGMYVPQGNSDALRDAIKYLWDHPDEAERMGREGRNQIELNNNWEQFIVNVKDVAQEVINEQVLKGR